MSKTQLVAHDFTQCLGLGGSLERLDLYSTETRCLSSALILFKARVLGALYSAQPEKDKWEQEQCSNAVDCLCSSLTQGQN